LLNGIDDIATRDDLRDRAIILHLPPISDEQRRDEDELWQEYERVRPRVLGALLDAVSMALRRWDETRLPWRPRMADYARWIAAAEPALPWKPGEHLEIYTGNRREAAAVSLESNAVAQAVLALMDRREEWEGTATELLAVLEQYANDRDRRSKHWPANARALSGRLRRAAPLLRQAGVEIEWSHRGRGADKQRVIRLRKVVQPTVPTDRLRPHPGHDGVFAGTRNGRGDASRVPTPSFASPHKGPSDGHGDDGDAGDANHATLFAFWAFPAPALDEGTDGL